jgi:4'-phosphopantetheinyl transferase
LKDLILQEESYSIYITNIENKDITAYSFCLSDEEEKRLSVLRSKKRKIEYGSVRYLLKKYIGDFTIDYDEEGAPKLSNGTAISISHSYNFVLIGETNKNKIGIDIEKIQHKIKNIAHKFLNTVDVKNLANTGNEITFTQVWCCKEAIFKMSSHKKLSIKEDIIINLNSSSKATANVNINNVPFIYSITLYSLDDYIIAVVVD